MFQYLKQPRDVGQYTMMRGVTDFANLKQFNLYESGYSYLVIAKTPKFMDELAPHSKNFETLWNTYLHMLEFEFRGIDGLDNITSDSQEITDGISTLNVITKTNMQSGGSTFSMRFWEKAGSVITRVHETYLRGLKDPRTQIKHYNGLLNGGLSSSITEPGFEHETFSFLYFVTDNTVTKIEKAYYIVGAQPTTAETNIYNSEKGNIEFKEITVEFSGFPITGDAVDERAEKVLKWMTSSSNPDRMYRSSANFAYTGIAESGNRIGAEAPADDPSITNSRF